MAQDTTFKGILDAANPNTLADALRLLGFGAILRAMKTFLHRVDPAVSAVQIAAVHSVALPDNAKAATILRATAIAGGGTKGELVVDLYGATPAAGHCAVAPNGDLAFAAADTWSSVDVAYEPDKSDVLELQLPVVAGTGVMALPAAYSARLKQVLAATVDEGGVTGDATVIVPGAVPGTTKQVNVDLAKTQVQFRIADAVTKATVRLALIPVIDVNALLGAQSSVL